MSFPSDVQPGIIKDNIIFGSFIHIRGGKLYRINTTGHMLYVVLILPNGLKLLFDPIMINQTNSLRSIIYSIEHLILSRSIELIY